MVLLSIKFFFTNLSCDNFCDLFAGQYIYYKFLSTFMTKCVHLIKVQTQSTSQSGFELISATTFKSFVTNVMCLKTFVSHTLSLFLLLRHNLYFYFLIIFMLKYFKNVSIITYRSLR